MRWRIPTRMKRSTTTWCYRSTTRRRLGLLTRHRKEGDERLARKELRSKFEPTIGFSEVKLNTAFNACFLSDGEDLDASINLLITIKRRLETIGTKLRERPYESYFGYTSKSLQDNCWFSFKGLDYWLPNYWWIERIDAYQIWNIESIKQQWLCFVYKAI